MAKLEDSGQRGLPPPPAPTRRGANPWPLSDTARKREAPPREEQMPRILEELLSGVPPQQRPAGPPRQPERRPLPEPGSRKRSGFLPLLVLLLIAGVVVRLALEARESGDWRELIPALFVIFFIAHSWWRSRRRREERGRNADRG